jgi:hypothetical protein
MRIQGLSSPPLPRTRCYATVQTKASAPTEAIQLSGASLPEQRSPLLNPTTQFVLGLALHKALMQGAAPSCLSSFQMREQSPTSQSEVRAAIWQNQGAEGVNSHLQGQVGERNYNGQFYSNTQTAGVNTTYNTPYCDFRDQAHMCTRGEDGGAVTRLDGRIDGQEAHLTSRLSELPGDENARYFRLNTMGDLGGRSYQLNTDFTINRQAGPNGELGGAVSNGYIGDQLIYQNENWTGSKPHAVLNQVNVSGQGQIAGVALSSSGQFTIRDDNNPALSLSNLLP